MRALTLIAIALLGTLVLTAGSYIQPTGTQATYVFQDSLSPFPSYGGIEETQIAGGTAQGGRNFGAHTSVRIGFSAAAGGPHKGLFRHNPFTIIDSTNLAAVDSVIFTITPEFVSMASPLVDTVYFFAEVESRWVEGTGIGGAGDTVGGASGEDWNTLGVGVAGDSTWKSFRSQKADSTLMSGLSSHRGDSTISGFSLESAHALGSLTQGSVDRAAFPSARLLVNSTITPAGTAQNVNITSIARYFMSRNQPLNIFVSLRSDTTGRGTWGTSDSCCQATSTHKFDICSGEYFSGSAYGLASHPKFTYYVRLKRMPVVLGKR